MKKRYYSSSSDSDSDAPLIKSSDDFRQNDLYKWNIERCEFCDAVFYNKYNIMVHNATHIIIPLIKQSVHECPKCYFHFTSATSLQEHVVMKHLNITNKRDFMPDLIKNIITREPYTVITKEEFSETDDTKAERDDILKSLVLKQPVTVLTKERFLLKNDIEEKVTNTVITDNKLLESFVNNEAITLLKPLVVTDEIINISDSESSIFDSEVSNSIENANFIEDTNSVDSYSQINRIKDRILFEDDDDDILNVNVPNDLNICNKSNIKDSVTDIKSNTIILGKYPCEETKSVHYNELTKPGLFMCKNCKKFFPNRYKLILHETKHISIKNRLPKLCRICDWYIANNRFKAHQKAKHLNKIALKTKLVRCRRCNLMYRSFYRHMMNYHNTYMCRRPECLILFDNEEDYKAHECSGRSCKTLRNGEARVQYNLNTLNVCDVCLLFFKDTSNRHYKCTGSVSKTGVRMKCDRCAKEYFELNVVNSQIKFTHRTRDRNKITNVERLRNLQQRLKKLKMLNKF